MSSKTQRSGPQGSTEAEQLDLFYLVDCVLDEIQQAKASSPADAKNSIDDVIDDDRQEMHGLAADFIDAEMMDRLGSDLDSLDSRTSHFYSYYGAPHDPQAHYTSAHPPFSPPMAHQSAPSHALSDLIDDVDDEYLNDVEREEMTGNNLPITMHTRDNVGRLVSEHAKMCQSDIVSTKTAQSDVCQEKEYLQNCEELQKFSDLIKFPEVTSQSATTLTSSLTTASTSTLQTEEAAREQQHRVLFQRTNLHFDEDSCDSSGSDFMSWTLKHPEDWSPTEVLDWLFYTAEKNGIDCSRFRAEAFRTVTGETLCKMTLNDFTRLEPCYGQIFYEMLRDKLSSGANFPPACFDHSVNPNLAPDYNGAQPYADKDCVTVPSPEMMSGPTSPYGGSTLSSMPSSHNSPEGYAYSPWTSNGDVYNSEVAHAQYQYPNNYQPGLYTAGPRHHPYGRTKQEVTDTPGPPRRRPGRPRIKSIPTEEELRAQREKKLKSQHLWEFIYEMLSNSSYNPSILKWENQSEGVFRFVQSESVAQLWGTLKGNENMTYEKLSRAMRHYYKRGILERVEGRRLVYKFSLGTLERLQQKKIQLLELLSQRSAPSYGNVASYGQYTVHPSVTSGIPFDLHSHNQVQYNFVNNINAVAVNTVNATGDVGHTNCVTAENNGSVTNYVTANQNIDLDASHSSSIPEVANESRYIYTTEDHDKYLTKEETYEASSNDKNIHFSMPTIE